MDMVTERGLAQSLRYNGRKYFRWMSPDCSTTVREVNYEFPYCDLRTAPFDEPIPREIWQSYETLSDVFDPKTIPDEWIEFMREASRLMQAKGVSRPVNLAWGVYFLIEESPLARERGLERMDRLAETGEPDYRDGPKLVATINMVLADPELRAELKEIISTMVPDLSMSTVSVDGVKRVLRKLGMTSGIVVDLGCGMGNETTQWAQALGQKVIGIDRQYHAEWYNRFWRDEWQQGQDLTFVRGDMMRGIPLREDSVEAILLQNVAQHVTQKALQEVLKESLRILKDGGLLFVGPESTNGGTSWRIFRKVRGETTTGYYLEECKYYDLVPEDKPKPWRRRRKRVLVGEGEK